MSQTLDFIKTLLEETIFSYINKIYIFYLFLSNGCNKNVMYLTPKLSNLTLIFLNLKTPNFISNCSFFLYFMYFSLIDLVFADFSFIILIFFSLKSISIIFLYALCVCVICYILKSYRFNILWLFNRYYQSTQNYNLKVFSILKLFLMFWVCRFFISVLEDY